MSMMNRQMPGLEKINIAAIKYVSTEYLCVVQYLSFSRISLRLSTTVRVSLVEFCADPPSPLYAFCQRYYLFTYTEHTHTHNIYVYIYLFCVPDGLLCASFDGFGLSSVVVFFTPAYCSLNFPVLSGCRKESPNSTWQNLCVSGK